MNLQINGESRATSAETVADLVAELSLHSVLVEHNGTALRRDEWTATALREGDRIEFVRIVAGG